MTNIKTSDYGNLFEEDVESALRRGLRAPWKFRRNVIYAISDNYPVQFDFLLRLGRHIINLECKSTTYAVIENVSEDATYKYRGNLNLSDKREKTIDVNKFSSESAVSQIIKQNTVLEKLFPGYVIESYKLWKTNSLYVMWNFPDSPFVEPKNLKVCEFIPHNRIGYLIDSLNGSAGLYANELNNVVLNTMSSGSARMNRCLETESDLEKIAESYEWTPEKYRSWLEGSNADTNKVMKVFEEDLKHIDYLIFGRTEMSKDILYEDDKGQLGFLPDCLSYDDFKKIKKYK